MWHLQQKQTRQKEESGKLSAATGMEYWEILPWMLLLSGVTEKRIVQFSAVPTTFTTFELVNKGKQGIDYFHEGLNSDCDTLLWQKNKSKRTSS